MTMVNDALTDADVGIGAELSDADVGLHAEERAKLADEMAKLRRERFFTDQEQAAIGAAQNIARVAAIPATPILKLPRSEGSGALSGLANVGANVAEGISAPAYWMMPETRILQALVAGQMAGHVPESTVNAVQTLNNPQATTAQKIEGVAAPILEGAAAGLITKGANAKDQIESTGGVPTEQQGVPTDRGAEGEVKTGVAQRGGESEQAVPQPAEVSKEPEGRNPIAVSGPQDISYKPALKLADGTIKVGEHDPLEREYGKGQRGFIGSDGVFYRGILDVVRERMSKAPPSEVAGEAKPSEAPVSAAVESSVAAEGTPQAKAEIVTPQPPDQLGSVTHDVTPPVSAGPGAASVGDVPAAPRQAIAAAEPIEKGGQRPLGLVSSVSAGLNNAREALANIGTTIKGIAGESLPKITKANREVGEAGARYAVSRVGAKPLAETFAAKVLQGTDVNPVKFGAALVEDNLRSIRETLRQKATEALADGNREAADHFTKQADNVATIVGSKGSPFSTEDAYFDFLKDPNVQRAVGQHIQMWQEVIDPQFRQAMSIDPDVPLPTRGQQTGARVNLRAVFPEEGDASNPVRGIVGSNLTGTFKRKSPFAVKAKGSGEMYDVNYNNLIQNTFERQLEIANKNKFDDLLVDKGLAVIDRPGQQVTIGGKPAVAFPISRKVLVLPREGEPAQAISQAKNIYVRSDIANEYEGAAGVGSKWRTNWFTKVANVINRAALSGLTDATVHLSNQLTALFDRPASGKLLTDSLLSATGRLDVPVTLVRTLMKAFEKNQEQISELAKIGAMRPQDIHFGVFGKLLQASDRVTRSMLDDTFKGLVESGLVENTETARREYVNQIGQYNRRLQGKITRLFRDTGLGPFATAGKTFNALGIRMATLSPGVKGASPFAAAALRANVLSKWVGASVLLATLNYLTTRKLKGGGILGRPGTPIGNVDLGTNDKSGKQQSFPLFSVLGVGRGLRVTGISGAVNAKRLGLTNADAAESASRDIINSWSAPFAGPPAKFAAISTTGYSPAVEVGRTSRIVPPGENQRLENVKEALRQASPLVQSYIKYREGKTTPEILSSQIPRFTMTPGKTESMVEKYPKIVALAQGGAFIDDMISQARKLPKEERRKFINEQVLRLPASQRSHARNEAVRRRVYTN